MKRERAENGGPCCVDVLFYGGNVVVPLLLGLAVYLRHRPDTHLAVLFGSLASALSRIPKRGPEGLIRFLRNFVPDMLWAYALTFAAAGVLRPGGRGRWGVLALCLGFSALMECLQLTALVPGTFDPLDLLLEAAAICLAFCIIQRYEGRETKWQGKQKRSV